MQGMGYAVMGTATASGSRRAIEAAQRAIASPLLEAGAIDGARGILINITGSASLKLTEVNEASTIIQSAAHEDANIIFGAVLDEKMKDSVKITVIATGFKDADIIRRRQEHGKTSFSPRDRMGFDEQETETTPEPPPMVMEPATPGAQVAPGEPATAMMPPAFPQEDLDVPAFLRKRNDVM
jgi:cell division protein FtsZ